MSVTVLCPSYVILSCEDRVLYPVSEEIDILSLSLLIPLNGHELRKICFLTCIKLFLILKFFPAVGSWRLNIY